MIWLKIGVKIVKFGIGSFNLGTDHRPGLSAIRATSALLDLGPRRGASDENRDFDAGQPSRAAFRTLLLKEQNNFLLMVGGNYNGLLKKRLKQLGLNLEVTKKLQHGLQSTNQY